MQIGEAYERIGEGAWMEEETLRVYFRLLISDMVVLYSAQYLNWWPTDPELGVVENSYTAVGFAGCAKSLYCMHANWKIALWLTNGSFIKVEKVSLLQSLQRYAMIKSFTIGIGFQEDVEQATTWAYSRHLLWCKKGCIESLNFD